MNNIKKTELKTIDIDVFNSELPDLKNSQDAKSVTIGKWLIQKIVSGIKTNAISINNILPAKSDFAYMLGVSIGTMQNAYRYIEDLGYVESKQCIGTIIKNYTSKTKNVRKLTSKRDLAVDAIKRYIISDKFSVGEILPSTRTISTIIGFGINTTRLAMEYLSTQGIISHKIKNSKEYGYILKSLNFSSENIHKSETLVEMVVKDMEKYIEENLNIGDKMPSHMVLSEKFKTSIKTVHDGLKVLSNKGIILARRGRYGSVILKKPNSKNLNLKPEMSIFAPAKEAAFYHYQKTQEKLKHLIANEYNVGDKIPSIMQLSKDMDLSPNTVRKALHNLSKEGYLVFSRGRYGGTFVIDIPEIEGQTFKWLAVNPQYAKNIVQN